MQEEEISHPVPRGMARSAMLSGLNIPVWHMSWVIGIPMILTLFARNPLWLVLIPVLAFVSRSITSEDEFQARCFYLGVISGSWLSPRPNGAHVVNALTANKKWQGMLHG